MGIIRANLGRSFCPDPKWVTDPPIAIVAIPTCIYGDLLQSSEHTLNNSERCRAPLVVDVFALSRDVGIVS